MADRPRFDAEERGYKLELAARIRQALEAAAAGREFVPALRRAFRAPNNLTHFLVHGPFLQWVGESPEAARAALAPLSDPALPPVERFARFVEGLPRFRRSGPGNLVALGSYLLMGVDPTRFPMVRVSRFEVVERALGWRLPPARSLAADLYAHHLGFAVWFLERLRAAEDAGPAPRTSGRAGTLGPVDMLDAQGLIWILAGAWGGQAPAVRAWRGDAAASPAPSLGSGQAHRTGGGVGPSRPPGPAAGPGTPSPSASGAAVYRLPAPDDRALVDLIAERAAPFEPPPADLEALADELLLDEAWLRDVVDLLREKGQIVFYGPPGTGKTHLARKLAEYLAPDPQQREVVQFHPSYSYEDFVHGYRPLARPDGTLGYELKAGPLLRLARRAAQSTAEHVLVIDELNRGNLPRILGELLYALEYRDADVALLYGDEGARFRLPRNLLVVGTMNTADRSIALLDAALRRRFHFVPLFPDRPPLAGLLRDWLARHRPAMGYVADVVDRLNARLRERLGPHLQLGPSYFMRPDLSERVLRRIWDADVMPFLEDQLAGREDELAYFSLETLLATQSEG